MVPKGSERDAAVTVRVDGVTVSLTGSSTPVVEDVSLSVHAGEVLGIVGESGSGKTTLALALLGHARHGLRITAGQVWLGETDLLGLSAKQLRTYRGRRVAYVPQDPAAALNPARRIGAQLRESLEVHEDSLSGISDIDERVAEVLSEVDLPVSRELLRSYPHQLSGGQQQRVTIAMAFSCRPDLIVMDEPTTGLDVTTQKHILATIRNLADAYEAAVAYVSHDLPVVGQVAQRVAVMYAGRIIETGPTAAILREPAHPYAIGLLRAAPTPERRSVLVGIEGRPPRPGQWPPGCPFAPRCERADAECLEQLPALREFGNGDRSVRCIHAGPETLETAVEVPSVDAGASIDSLVVTNLGARYGDKEVVFDVDFEIPAATCMGLVGQSGSGKTTLARCLVGEHANWSGQLLFNGDAPLARGARERSDEQRRRIQYVFQNPYTSLNPRRTIRQALAAPLEHFEQLSRSERNDRIAAMIEDVALDTTFLDRYPQELSGGERQRVAIGRALIVEPQLLVCDEVTSALDVSVQAVIIELLRRLQSERQISMLFITHNIAVVRSIAQRMIVMHEGRVVENGAVDEVMGQPRDDYTARLLADVPTLSGVRDLESTAGESRADSTSLGPLGETRS